MLEELTWGEGLLLSLLLLYEGVVEMGMVVNHMRLERLHVHPRIEWLQALTGVGHG